LEERREKGQKRIPKKKEEDLHRRKSSERDVDEKKKRYFSQEVKQDRFCTDFMTTAFN